MSSHIWHMMSDVTGMSDFLKSVDGLVDVQVAREKGDSEETEFVQDQSNWSGGSRWIAQDMLRLNCYSPLEQGKSRWLQGRWRCRWRQWAELQEWAMMQVRWSLILSRASCNVYIINHRDLKHFEKTCYSLLMSLLALQRRVWRAWVTESCVVLCFCDAIIMFQAPAWFLWKCRPVGFLCSIINAVFNLKAGKHPAMATKTSTIKNIKIKIYKN